MTKVYTNRNVAYALNQPTITGAPLPIVSVRDPTANDHAEVGTTWINKTDNSVFTITSIVANMAVWTNTAGAGEIVASITATVGPNSLTGTTGINTAGAATTTIGTGGTGLVRIGNATGNTSVTGALAATTALSAGTSVTAGTGISSTTGNIVAAAGQVNSFTSMSAGTTITAGTGITATAGNIIATLGNISSTAGSVQAGTTVVAGTNIISTAGNITASVGNVVSSMGNVVATVGQVNAGASMSAGTTIAAGTTITAGTGITSTAGNIQATAGDLRSGGDVELLGGGGAVVFQPGPLITAGAMAPIGAAPKGTLYLTPAGTGAADRAYINTDGAMGWTAIVTVA